MSDEAQEQPIEGKQKKTSRKARCLIGEGKQRTQSGVEYDSNDSEASVPLSVVKTSQAIINRPHVHVKDKPRSSKSS